MRGKTTRELCKDEDVIKISLEILIYHLFYFID